MLRPRKKRLAEKYFVRSGNKKDSDGLTLIHTDYKEIQRFIQIRVVVSI